MCRMISVEALIRHATDFAEKRRILQLETLYDLALALYADRPEGELVECRVAPTKKLGYNRF